MSNRMDDQILNKRWTAGTGGVTKYAVVVQGASDGQVILPGAADAPKIVGVAMEAASASDPVDVRMIGNAICIASEAISRGDYVSIGGVLGTVRSATRCAAEGAQVIGIVGRANEAAAASGDQISVTLLRIDLPIFAELRTVGTGGVTANMVCCEGTGGDVGKVVLPSAADVQPAGVALATVAATGTVAVALPPAIVDVSAGAAIVRGVAVSINGTDGQIKTAAPGVGANTFLVGHTRGAAAADNNLVKVQLGFSTMQGA